MMFKSTTNNYKTDTNPFIISNFDGKISTYLHQETEVTVLFFEQLLRPFTEWKLH